ncbi:MULTISPECIES: hypothetical protein [Niastella]|nr:hypothetical protein [Niastella soli]
MYAKEAEVGSNEVGGKVDQLPVDQDRTKEVDTLIGVIKEV